jgi:hypothetical protein
MNLTNGCAPLHYAVAKGQTGMVQFPMESGANPLLANQHVSGLGLRRRTMNIVTVMIAGGLLKTITADVLLQSAEQRGDSAARLSRRWVAKGAGHAGSN